MCRNLLEKCVQYSQSKNNTKTNNYNDLLVMLFQMLQWNNFALIWTNVRYVYKGTGLNLWILKY